MAERLRGRRAVEQRLRRLRAEPLCRDCASAGIVREASVPDHIVPLAQGGDDSDANIRNLCRSCHDTRTREQFGLKKKARITVSGWPEDEPSSG